MLNGVVEWVQVPRPAEAWLLVGLWLAVFEGGQRAFWRLALLSMPGTILHEAAHFVVGLLLGARPRSFDVLPERSKTGWTLGSVELTRTNLFNAAPACLAPLLLLPMAGKVFDIWVVPACGHGRHGRAVVGAFLVANCLHAFWPSGQDWRICRTSLLAWLGGLGVVVLLALRS